VNSRDLLSPADIEHAWRLAFTQSLDDHPDTEIAWEAAWWRQHGVPSVAKVCHDLLAERRAATFVIPGGADAADLDRLLARVDARPALRLVRDEALCLLAAMRLVYWAGLREAAR
jgi:hypothetical protein